MTEFKNSRQAPHWPLAMVRASERSTLVLRAQTNRVDVYKSYLICLFDLLTDSSKNLIHIKKISKMLASILRPTVRPLLSRSVHLQTTRFAPAIAASATQNQAHSQHKHDKLWKAERYLSVGLLGVLPAAVLFPHPIMDHAVALSLVVHIHWGFEGIVVDYIRPSIFGPTIPKISIALLYVLSSLALGGLFVFNHTDVGITHATRMLANL